MLVTAIMAGLLIYDPLELPSRSTALAIDASRGPANVVPALVQAEAGLAMEAPPPVRPQEGDAVGAVGALPDKPVASVALQPSPAPNRSQKQPVLQSAAQIPGARRDLGKRKTYRAEDARDCCSEGRRRETRWMENARDSRRPQHIIWRCPSCDRRPPCDDCH